MGKYDVCMQEYLQNKEYFADLFNGCFFHGRPVICANELTEASEGYVLDQNNPSASETALPAMEVTTVSDTSGAEIQIEKRRHRPGRREKTKTKLMRDVKMQLRSGTVL